MDYRQDWRRREWESRGDEFFDRSEEGQREFDRRPEERGGATAESWGGWSRQAGSPYGYFADPPMTSIPRGRFTGRGPKNYQRSDERIREDVNERLADNADLDATDIEVSVSQREVTLEGKVEDRRAKRLAEDIAEAVPGVQDVHNHLKVKEGFFAQLFGTSDDETRAGSEDTTRREERRQIPIASEPTGSSSSTTSTSTSRSRPRR
jgi:hypothetical protein